MKSIETLEESEQMLAMDKCLVFVAASWSPPSKIGENKLLECERLFKSVRFSALDGMED